jgi:hypothetical protein
MKRGKRIAFPVMAAGLAVLFALAHLQWDTIRDHVSPVVTRAAPRLKTRIHQVRFAKVEEIVLAIGSVEDSPRALVIPHVGTNSLVIRAPPGDFERIVEKIGELDASARGFEARGRLPR